MQWIKAEIEKYIDLINEFKEREPTEVIRGIYQAHVEELQQAISRIEDYAPYMEPSPDLEAEAEKVFPDPDPEKYSKTDLSIRQFNTQLLRTGFWEAARRYATTVEAKEREIADLKDTADGIEKDLRALKQENERLNTLIAHYELSEANYKKTLHIQRQLIEQSKDCFKKVKELEDENARLQKLVAQKIE